MIECQSCAQRRKRMRPRSSSRQIPERGDYKAHYLDESNAPLFAFGFGLSYSKFKLEELSLPQRLGRDDTHRVKVRITNTSEVDGDEVPQLYVRPRVASSVTGKKLVAYRRVHLAAHESQIVELTVPASALSIMGPDDRWRLESGTYEVLLGTSSRDGLAGTFELADAARVATTATTHP